MASPQRKLAPPDWALRISIALVFLVIGSEKILGASWVPLFADIGLGQWFRYFAGIVQLTGAVLYATPRTSLFGMMLLACSMAGAVCVHLFVLGTGAAALIPGVLLGVIVFGWMHGQRALGEAPLTIR